MTLIHRALALAVACAGCAQPKPGSPPAGRSQFALQTPSLPGLTSVDYTLHFWFLGAVPPLAYDTYLASSASGSVFAILPCFSDRSGLNQVRADAVLHFAGAPDLAGSASAIFSCQQSLDTPVSLVISAVRGTGVGYGDIAGLAAGVSCQSAINLRGDSYLAVCAESTCGDSGAVFLFTNSCRALDGSAPSFWACGPPTDWTLLGPLASSAFTLVRDGTFRFGIAAPPAVKLSAPDPTLTDASGNLLVWGAVATPAATLIRSGGAVTRSTLDATRTASFAARLQAAGGPPLLLEVQGGAAGAALFAWTPLGPCLAPAAGVASLPGLFVVDVRLASPAVATLLLAAAPAGPASQRSSCTATAAGAILCSAPGPL